MYEVRQKELVENNIKEHFAFRHNIIIWKYKWCVCVCVLGGGEYLNIAVNLLGRCPKYGSGFRMNEEKDKE